MISSLLFLAAALACLLLCLRSFQSIQSRPRVHLLLWGLAALMLLAAFAFQNAGSLASLEKTGRRLIYLAGASTALLCLGLGMVYRTGKRLGVILATLTSFVLLLAIAWGLLAEGRVNLSLPGLEGQALPGFGIMVIRLAGLTGALLTLIPGAVFGWHSFWESGDLTVGKRRAALLAAILPLTASILFSFLASRAWVQASLGLLGAALLLFGASGKGWEAGPTLQIGEKELHRVRMKVRFIGIVSVLVAAFGFMALLPVLPFLMGLVGDVQQNVYVSELPPGAVGDFMVTPKGIMPLYEWYMPLQSAPNDAPVLQTGEAQQVIIFQKQTYPPEDYQLYTLETGERIPWAGSQRTYGQITLTAPLLMPGSYMLVVPTNGMFGGEIYHYFCVGVVSTPVQ